MEILGNTENYNHFHRNSRCLSLVVNDGVECSGSRINSLDGSLGGNVRRILTISLAEFMILKSSSDVNIEEFSIQILPEKISIYR